jgi:hypothetical protein
MISIINSLYLCLSLSLFIPLCLCLSVSLYLSHPISFSPSASLENACISKIGDIMIAAAAPSLAPTHYIDYTKILPFVFHWVTDETSFSID